MLSELTVIPNICRYIMQTYRVQTKEAVNVNTFSLSLTTIHGPTTGGVTCVVGVWGGRVEGGHAAFAPVNLQAKHLYIHA